MLYLTTQVGYEREEFHAKRAQVRTCVFFVLKWSTGGRRRSAKVGPSFRDPRNPTKMEKSTDLAHYFFRKGKLSK